MFINSRMSQNGHRDFLWQLETVSSNLFFSLLSDSVASLCPIKFTCCLIQPLVSVVKQKNNMWYIHTCYFLCVSSFTMSCFFICQFSISSCFGYSYSIVTFTKMCSVIQCQEMLQKKKAGGLQLSKHEKHRDK